MKLETCPKCYGTKFYFINVLKKETNPTKEDYHQVKEGGTRVELCDFCWGRGKIIWLDYLLNKPSERRDNGREYSTNGRKEYIVYMNDGKRTGEILEVPTPKALKKAYRKLNKKPTIQGVLINHVYTPDSKEDSGIRYW